MSEREQFQRIDSAFRAGDLAALRAAVDEPEHFPLTHAPLAIGNWLEYAIYHSPLRFIRELLEAGADTNPDDHAGFPPIIAALSCFNAVPGAKARPDVHEIVKLLLEFKSDPNQRGHNDYTPLHWAAGSGDVESIRVLLAGGADPSLRTRIDDLETPLEVAVKAGHDEVVAVLKG